MTTPNAKPIVSPFAQLLPEWASLAASEPIKKVYTNTFVKSNNKTLLGRKTRGLGVNLWNGFGGKVEPSDASVEAAAQRELREESNLIALDLRQIGVILYHMQATQQRLIVHIFTCSRYENEERPSEEMNPLRWFSFEEVPFDSMWDDARAWFPLMWADKYFFAVFTYNEKGVTGSCMQTCDSLKEVFEFLNYCGS